MAIYVFINIMISDIYRCAVFGRTDKSKLVSEFGDPLNRTVRFEFLRTF